MFIITLDHDLNQVQLARIANQLKGLNAGPWVVIPKGCTVQYFPPVFKWLRPAWWWWKLKGERQYRKALAGMGVSSEVVKVIQRGGERGPAPTDHRPSQPPAPPAPAPRDTTRATLAGWEGEYHPGR